MGSTSLVCFIAGYFLNLNQAILHVFKSLTYPLHLALILVFIRLRQQRIVFLRQHLNLLGNRDQSYSNR